MDKDTEAWRKSVDDRLSKIENGQAEMQGDVAIAINLLQDLLGSKVEASVANGSADTLPPTSRDDAPEH